MDESLTGADVGSLRGNDIVDESLTGADIASGTLTNQDVGVLYANVLANGTLDRSSGGIVATRQGLGSYKVDINRVVYNCAFSATVGNPDNFTHCEGEADVAAQFDELDSVRVYTRTAGTSTEADLPFMLTVVC